MTVFTLILVIAVICAIVYLFRYIPPPWTWVAAGIIILLLVLLLFQLLGGGIGLGTRIG